MIKKRPITEYETIYVRHKMKDSQLTYFNLTIFLSKLEEVFKKRVNKIIIYFMQKGFSIIIGICGS